jgi:hypothetical protein
MASTEKYLLHHITLTSKHIHNPTTQHHIYEPTTQSQLYNELNQNSSPTLTTATIKTNMYTSILFAALAATGAFAMPATANELVSRQAIDPNSVVVEVNNSTLGGPTTFFADNFPESQVALGGIVGPFDSVTLTLGDNVNATDPTLRCQILGTDGQAIRLNRGKNLNKSTFSAGLKWDFVDGLTEVVVITCPVAAPEDEQ